MAGAVAARTERRTGAQALAEAIAAEGVEVVFGVLGEGNLHVVADLQERHGVRYVATRHEAAAVAAATGYARASGRPGVCTVTQGPGLTNTATALTEARKSGASVLLLTGGVPRHLRGNAQDTDQRAFALATAGALHAADVPWRLTEDVHAAFRHVRLGRGPTVLEVPVDVQHAEVAGDPAYVPTTATVIDGGRRHPDPGRVAEVAALLADAQRPVILAGRGAVRSGARDELLALAERTGALLCTTLPAKGWFAGHPFDLGIAGPFGHEVAQEVLPQADLVLAFGAGLNRFTTGHGTLFADARIVHVDLDDAAVGRTVVPDEAIVADARATAVALLAALGPGAPAPGLRSAALCERLATLDPLAGVRFAGPDGGADPREAARICDRLLPRDRVVVLGIGHFNGYPAIHVGVVHPDDLVLPWGFGAVGLALPTAIGVAMARPDRTVVVFEGDGGLMMSLPELETAAREGVRLLVVVCDDGAYGAETYMLRRHGRDPAPSLFDNPDFAEVGRALGLAAHGAQDAAELEAALAAALPVRGPTLIRVRMNPSVWHEEVFRALTG